MTLSNLSEVRKKAWETRRLTYGNKGYAKTYAKPGWNEAIEAAALKAEQMLVYADTTSEADKVIPAAIRALAK